MKRPLIVTIISCLFIVAGVAGIVYHASEWKTMGLQTETIWAFGVRLLAIVGGILALRGSNIARWVLVLWILFHVGLSFFHSGTELLTHIAFAVVVLLGLFNPKANLYFKRA